MSRARPRRPLIALVVLVLALLLGYAFRAVHSDEPPGPTRAPTTHSVSSP